MDLIVCVGDHCHLSGSEMVVRSLQQRLAGSRLAGRVTLKGCFCCGQCDGHEEDDLVTLRLHGEVFHTRYQDAEACFDEQLEPRLERLLAGA